MIKNKTIEKKNRKVHDSNDRNVCLRQPDHLKTILLIADEENTQTKKLAEKTFPSSRVHHLFTRKSKEDGSKGFNYSVHTSDFGITGKLKNEHLLHLEKMPFDLVIDLSSDIEQLNYFLLRTPANLILGRNNSTNNHLHDLIFDYKQNDQNFLEYIREKLTLLTKNGNN